MLEAAMQRVRRFVIILHRYLGIALSVLFVVWFLSGIGMMYGRGMPSLTAKLRLERLYPVDLTKVHWSAGQAAASLSGGRPGRAVLLTVMDRPAYRFGARTVFADNGEVMKRLGPDEALNVAAEFARKSKDKLRFSVQNNVDQWTISQRRQLPLYRIAVDDEERTTLYISPQSGEVVVLTTRGSRALAWVSAIPHWLYFTSLRTNDSAWRQVVIWTSSAGCILALAGITLGFIQFRYKRPLRLPYAGTMRWHYITGVVFGVVTFTWVFSGLLSMEPWNWASSPVGFDILPNTLVGDALDIDSFPALDSSSWNGLRLFDDLKEIEFRSIQGNPHYIVRASSGARTLIDARTMIPRSDLLSVDSLMTQVRQTYRNFPILDSSLMTDYDSYYYATIDREAPLPILRVRFGDREKTWTYIDPSAGQIVRNVQWKGRIERWIYHGFHSLDFRSLYYHRPGWDVVMIVLSLGGAATSVIGMILGFRRLFRGSSRMVTAEDVLDPLKTGSR